MQLVSGLGPKKDQTDYEGKKGQAPSGANRSGEVSDMASQRRDSAPSYPLAVRDREQSAGGRREWIT
jgi:hypothetical protein